MNALESRSRPSQHPPVRLPGVLAMAALLTLTVLAPIHVAADTPGGNFCVVGQDAECPGPTPLAAFLLNGPPYGTPPSPCTTIGRAQENTYRIVEFGDRTSGDPTQPDQKDIVKVVFEAQRQSESKYIQWLPTPSSFSYHPDWSDPAPVFRNVSYVAGGPVQLNGVTIERPDQLIFEGGVMPVTGGQFRIAFTVRGNPAAGSVIGIHLKVYFGDGNGLQTNGFAYGATEDATANPRDLHAHTDDQLCDAGPLARDLEFRVDTSNPTLSPTAISTNPITGLSMGSPAEVYDLDNNGHLDHLRMTFSEPVDVNAFDIYQFNVSSRVGGAVRIYQPILPVKWEVNPVSGLQMHDTVNVTLVEIPQYDTGDMPQITYPNGAAHTFQDQAGNTQSTVRFQSVNVIDRASPVMMSAYAYVGARQLVVTFSEGVYGSGATPDEGQNNCGFRDPANGFPRFMVLKCDLEYVDGQPDFTDPLCATNCPAPSSATDNCIRGPDMTEFDEPDPNVSPAGSSTIVFPLVQTAGSVGERTGFCELDVNYTKGYNDWIRPRATLPPPGTNPTNGAPNNDGLPGPPAVAPTTDTRQYAFVVRDAAGNPAWSPPDCAPQPRGSIKLTGRAIHDEKTQDFRGYNGPDTVPPGPCRFEMGYSVPVTPPRVIWAQADNDHGDIVLHFSGPVTNATGPGQTVDIRALDVVTSTGGGAGGIVKIDQIPNTDSMVLHLDHPINPQDIGDNPSFIRVRCDPNRGAPWSWINGYKLPSRAQDNMRLSSYPPTNRLPDGRAVPPSVTVACGDYRMYDKTPPRILYANTTDTNHDGYIDGYSFLFSEPIDDASFCGATNPTSHGCSSEKFVGEGMFSLLGSPSTSDGPGVGTNGELETRRMIDPLTNFTYDTGQKDNDRVGFIHFDENFPPFHHNRLLTDAVPDFVTSATAHLFQDLVDPLHGGNKMEPIGTFDLVERDGAGPAPLMAQSIDSPVNGGQFNKLVEGDGYIDAYRVTFSEAVRDSTFEKCEWMVDGYNVTGMTSFGVTDVDDTHPPILLQNDRQFLVQFAPNKANDDNGDTDAKPEMTYTRGGGPSCPPTVHPFGLTDPFGNPMQTFREGDVIETDTAAPSIVSIVAHPGDINATVIFSEPVDNGHGKPIVWRDFIYGNNNTRTQYDSATGQSPTKDANQNTRPAIDEALRTGQDPPTPIPGTQFVLLPLDHPLSGPPACAGKCDIGSDLLGMHVDHAREVAPSVPPRERQWVSTVPHYVGVAADIIPPGAILDLSINGQTPTGNSGIPCGLGGTLGSITANSVVLQWHAPGDDDYQGTVANYTVKVSILDITPDNFDAVVNPPGLTFELTSVDGSPFILPANGLQTMKVIGLEPATSYYFAVRPVDDVGNLGPVSNSCSATTLQDSTPPTGVLTVTSSEFPQGGTTQNTGGTFTWNDVQSSEKESVVVYRYSLNENPDYQVLSTDIQTALDPSCKCGRAVFAPGSVPNGTWTFSVAPFSAGGGGKTTHYSFTVGPASISAQKIRDADAALQARTHAVRRNGLNTVSWQLPDKKTLPGPIEAVEIWRLDSGVPVKLITLCGPILNNMTYPCPGNYELLHYGNFTDPTPTATPDSQYRVDMVFVHNQAQPQTLTGFKTLENGGGNGVPLWVYVVLGIALALILAGIVIFVVLRTRTRKAAAAEAVPYQWTHTGEVVLDPITGLPIHDVKCPSCSVDFQAQGELPLQITCPSCGVSGVLN